MYGSQQIVFALDPAIDGPDGHVGTHRHLGEGEAIRTTLDQEGDSRVQGSFQRLATAFLLRWFQVGVDRLDVGVRRPFEGTRGCGTLTGRRRHLLANPRVCHLLINTRIEPRCPISGARKDECRGRVSRRRKSARRDPRTCVGLKQSDDRSPV